MIGIADVARAETDLAAGRLACPACGGKLRRWGHARTRTVRDHDRTILVLRARRTRCQACATTHVLLPGQVLPRRADTTAVIGSALLAHARGAGHRRIAAERGHAPSTVRRWLRCARGAHVEWLRARGVGWLARVDPEVISTLAPEPTRLGEALTALAAAALRIRARLLPHVPAWTVIGVITAGRLLPRCRSG